LAAQVKGDVRKAAGLDSPDLRRLSRTDWMGLTAAGEASAEAGLDTSEENPRIGICLGSSTGGQFEAEDYFLDYQKMGFSRSRVSRLLSFPISTTSDAIARTFRLGGPNASQMSACSSAAAAIGFAADLIQHGLADAMVAGGSDGLCRLTYTGFNSLRAVDRGPCRPFDRERKGLSLGEGAGVLILEDWEAAQKRGAHVLAEFLGYGSSCDAYHMTAPHPEGDGAAACMRMALESAGIRPSDVNYINAHGTGTRNNDAMEALAIRACFGDSLRHIPVSSTKAMVGHTLGAAGGVEAVISLLALLHQHVPPTLGLSEQDESVKLDCAPNSSRPHAMQVVLSNSFGFGGANVTIVLGAPDFREASHETA
jgi:3-oxoacyl-[acyl-carrier-protein] synthase II